MNLYLTGEVQGIMVSDQEFGELKGQMEEMKDVLNRKFDHLDKKLFGNGQPGLVEQTTRNQEQVYELGDKLDSVIDSLNKISCDVAALTKSVADLKTVVETHINDPIHTPKGQFMKHTKQIAILFMIGFVILHTFLPAEFTIWELLKKLLGV